MNCKSRGMGDSNEESSAGDRIWIGSNISSDDGWADGFASILLVAVWVGFGVREITVGLTWIIFAGVSVGSGAVGDNAGVRNGIEVETGVRIVGVARLLNVCVGELTSGVTVTSLTSCVSVEIHPLIKKNTNTLNTTALSHFKPGEEWKLK